jgi:phosphate transport system permease protein
VIFSPSEDRSLAETITDRLLAVSAWTAALLIVSVLIFITGDLLKHGVARIDWRFFTSIPLDAGREGGIASVLFSTIIILCITMAVAVPISLMTAVLLAEHSRKGNFFGTCVRLSLDVLAGVPSIVFGLFGNVFFCKIIGLGYSLLAGGLTLACMVLPILIRTCEEGLRSIPTGYRHAAIALAYSRTATLWHILLPAAIPSLVTGIALGVGRAIAETAALIFTSGYVDRMPESWLDSGRTLSVHIFDLSMNIGGGEPTAAATSLTLILILFTVNSAVAKGARALTKSPQIQYQRITR